MGSIRVFDKTTNTWKRITPDEASAIKTNSSKLLEYLGGVPVAEIENVMEHLVDDTLLLKKNVNWLARNKASGQSPIEELYVPVSAQGDTFTIDRTTTPYANIELRGMPTIFNLVITNAAEGNKGRILVFQGGGKLLALDDTKLKKIKKYLYFLINMFLHFF